MCREQFHDPLYCQMYIRNNIITYCDVIMCHGTINPIEEVKGIVYLNTIFSYMTFNKICNLNHPVHWKLFMLDFSLMYIITLSMLCYSLFWMESPYPDPDGDSILSSTFCRDHIVDITFLFYDPLWYHNR